LYIFSEKNVDTAMVEDITEKDHIGKGTLYRHFAGKEEVVFVLMKNAIKHLIERLTFYPDKPEIPKDVLKHFYVSAVQSEVAQYRVLSKEVKNGNTNHS
jgi:AcrR family transcriptional regulator